jgi:predicted kinase
MESEELTGCVMVTGMPGAGKSTVTTLAARLLPRAAVLSGDTLNMMIVSGRVGFLQEPADEARRQGDLCNLNLCTLANNFVDAGFTVLMDTVVADRAELDLMVGLMVPRMVRLVVLAAGPDVCRHRNAHRDPSDQFDFDGYEGLHADMRRDLSEHGWWFDTSDLTPAETAERLVGEAVRRAVPLPR